MTDRGRKTTRCLQALQVRVVNLKFMRESQSQATDKIFAACLNARRAKFKAAKSALQNGAELKRAFKSRKKSKFKARRGAIKEYE